MRTKQLSAFGTQKTVSPPPEGPLTLMSHVKLRSRHSPSIRRLYGRARSPCEAILALAVPWKPLGHFENTTWHKPTNCRVDDNDISNLEFV